MAIFDAGCKCITANYTLNDDGTVGVVNTCQSLGLPVSISGSAAVADTAYGEAGVFDVTLAGSDGICPGPNYIVQGEQPTSLSLTPPPSPPSPPKPPQWTPARGLKIDVLIFVRQSMLRVTMPSCSRPTSRRCSSSAGCRT